MFLSMTDSEEEVTHLSDSGSEYDPVEDSCSMTDSSDDGVVVPAKVRRTKPRSSSAVVEVQESQVPRMEQSSTSAAIPSGELASTSDLVHPGHTSSTAVTLGDVASPISAVQAGEDEHRPIVPIVPFLLHSPILIGNPPLLQHPYYPIDWPTRHSGGNS
ncbi:hypothetical protein AB205_0208870 [Aquarana catesbeiana]|uniref:Uncharacterized protein n=1 Tax=Aquarana catesbeiana TaxID=8400 RepID=A0A2G9Q5T7_AQUCT|nr:hypothetical protein AB205_0208870 [Aquarana catesbeiana]